MCEPPDERPYLQEVAEKLMQFLAGSDVAEPYLLWKKSEGDYHSFREEAV